MTETEREMVGGAVGGKSSPDKERFFFSSSKESELGKSSLSILVKIMKANGESLPFGEVSVELV